MLRKIFQKVFLRSNLTQYLTKYLGYYPNLFQEPSGNILRFFQIRIAHRNVSHFSEGLGVFLSI